MANRHETQAPERKCIATGEVRPKADLLRFCVSPDGALVPDIAGKLPGRGIYVTARLSALSDAVDRRLFARAARAPVHVDDGLAAQVTQMVARRVVELLSLARKAGLAVAGYEKVKAYLDRGEAQVLLQACDGSARGKTKLSTPHFGTYIGWLTADELGAAFGRAQVIHAALGSGGLTQRVVHEAGRLRGLRTESAGTAAGKDRTA